MDLKSSSYHAIFDARRHSLQRQQGTTKIIPISETPPVASVRKEYEYNFPTEAAVLQQQLRKTMGFVRRPKEKSAPHVVDLTTSFKEQTPKPYFRPKSSEGYPPPVALPNKYTRSYRPQSHSASASTAASSSNSTRSTTPVQSNRESASLNILKEKEKGFQILNHDQENGIYFLRNPNFPNQILIKRNRDNSKQQQQLPDKESEKMKLENKDLKTFPIISDAEQLRVLSLEHNNIEIIENTHYLSNLVYLDLYDNGIKKIEGLNHLTQLRVLMLGKNRIKTISGLRELVQLDVLDLHSNEIEMVNDLDTLTLLRVLNLAGNKLNSITGFDSLISLIELNLKKNFIGKCEGMPLLPHLQRLYLSDNKIATIQRLNPLQSITTLSDISLEGNPLCSIKYYRYQLILSFQQIKVLDNIAINDEERRRATSIVATKHVSHPSSASSQREQLNNYIKENGNLNPNSNGRSTSLGFTHPSPNSRNPNTISGNNNNNNIVTPIHQSPTSQNNHKKLLTSTSITTITSNPPDINTINTTTTTPLVAFQQPSQQQQQSIQSQQPKQSPQSSSTGKPPIITTTNVNTTKVPIPPASSPKNPIPTPTQQSIEKQHLDKQPIEKQQQQFQQPQPSPVNSYQKSLQQNENNNNQIMTQAISPKPLNRMLKRNTTPTPSATQSMTQAQPQTQQQQQNQRKMKSKELFIGSEQFVQLSNDSYPEYITHIIFDNNDIHFICQHINKLKRYKYLTALTFSNANITDFKQIEFLNIFSEKVTNIEISINGNEITHCSLFRLFMIHYFPFLNMINKEYVLPEERFNAKRFFPNLQEIRPLPIVNSSNDSLVEEFSNSYVDNIVNDTIKIENRIEIINDTWSKYIHDVVNSFGKEDDDQSYMDHCLDHLIDNIK